MTGAPRHPTDDALQEWVDRTLDAAEAGRVADHVAGCEPCRAETARLRGLLLALRSLPREMTPPASTRAGARQGALGADVAPIGPAHLQGRAAHRRVGLAAAAVALLLIGAASAWLLGSGGERATPGAAGPAPSAVPVAADYDRAVADLAAALEARRDELDPATVRIVEENLRIVDEALREARAALAADPSDPVLRELVVLGYEQKLDLLRRATRPAGEI